MSKILPTCTQRFVGKGLATSTVAALLLLGISEAALSGEPAAVVEDVQGRGVPVELFEFLETGRNIELGKDATVIIGYLKSCRRETINGGTIVVGVDKSTVTGGKLSAETVECDGGKMNISSDLAAKSAVAVFRQAPGKHRKSTQPSAQLTIYSLTPFILAAHSAKSVEIERLDKPARPIAVAFDNGIADLADRNIALAPGGLYGIQVADTRLVVRIDALSGKGGPVLSRLIRFAQ